MGRATEQGAIWGIVVLVLVLGLAAAVLLADPGPPDWSVNPGDYDFDGSITAGVWTGGTQVGGASDLLGAFVGTECRGVIGSTYLPNETYIFYLRVYSNASSGEIMSFKFYDAAADTEAYIIETEEFVPDMTVGTTFTPYEMNTSHAPATDPTFWGRIKLLYE
jgi:hypothetical protein